MSVLHSSFSFRSTDPVLTAEVATFMECVKLTADQVGSVHGVCEAYC